MKHLILLKIINSNISDAVPQWLTAVLMAEEDLHNILPFVLTQVVFV